MDVVTGPAHEGPRLQFTYNAFLSYSHSADARLATAFSGRSTGSPNGRSACAPSEYFATRRAWAQTRRSGPRSNMRYGPPST